MITSIKLFWKDVNNRAVASVFLAMSLAFGAWVTRLPEIQSRLELTDGQLGTALFCLPLGAVTLLPFYSKIIYKLTERVTVLLALFILLTGIVLPTLAPNYAWLLASLYLVGLAIGLTDVSMNAIAAEIEKQKDVRIMSTCHGFFSLGGMLGAMVSAFFINFNLDLTQQMLAVGLLSYLWVIRYASKLTNSLEPPSEQGFSFPPKAVLTLAVIGICVMMTEGAITDWSTIYIERDLAVNNQWSVLGFAGFSLAMAIGRFYGDDLTAKFNSRIMVRAGILLGVIGLLLVFIREPLLVILGFTLSGLGLSVVVPVLFSTAAKAKGVSPARGLAAVASAGYVGWLLGPVTIGYLADAFTLRIAFVFVCALCTTAFLLSFMMPSSSAE